MNYSGKHSIMRIAVQALNIALSVSAVVDLSQAQEATSEDAGGAAASAAVPVLTVEAIEKMIKGAVGFNETRDDLVEVILAPLAPIERFEPAIPGFVWEKWQPLIQSLSLGLAAMLTFLIGMMLLKRMKPIMITEKHGDGISLADARRLAAISDQAKAHPEVVAQIISAWLNEQQTVTPDQLSSIPVESGRTSPHPAGGASFPKSVKPAAKAA